MFKCPECRIGNIIPRYRRDADPKYKCSVCGHIHKPVKRQYKTWRMISNPFKAMGVPMEVTTAALERMAETLIPMPTLDPNIGSAKWPEVSGERYASVHRPKRKGLIGRFLDWLAGR